MGAPPYYVEEEGMFKDTRLTDCCRSFSTFPIDGGGMLCCKTCWGEVPMGQGDGSERRPSTAVPREVSDGTL